MEEKKEDKKVEGKPDSLPMLSEAKATADRIEALNTKLEDNIGKLERLESIKLLGGQSEGQGQKEEKKDIDPVEYAKMALEGKIPPKEE